METRIASEVGGGAIVSELPLDLSEVAVDEEIPPAAADPAARREAVVREDERLVADASTLLAGLCADPEAAIHLAQTWIRDLGLESREESAISASDRARLDTVLNAAAREAETAARAAAANDSLIAKIFGYIGAAIAIAVGTIGAVFSGGATLAFAIAAVVLIAAATTTNLLVDTKCVDAEVGGAVALGCSIAATICSLGAAVAGTATMAAGSAARIASDALSYTNSAVQLVSAGANTAGTMHTHTADLAEANAAHASTDRADARADLEESADAIRGLFRSHRRSAERAAEIRQIRADGMRAVAMRG